MIKRFLNVLLINILFCIGCSSPEKEPPPYRKHVNEITNSFCDEMKKEHDLYVIGSGGSMPYAVKSITLHFNTEKKIDIAAARVLFVKCTERLIKKMNDHKDLREYLTNYPADDRNADLMISFENADGSRVIDDHYLSLIFYSERKIFYKIFDEENNCLQTVYKEPYSEALEIVKKQKETHD